jgi:hypothetical protein
MYAAQAHRKHVASKDLTAQHSTAWRRPTCQVLAPAVLEPPVGLGRLTQRGCNVHLDVISLNLTWSTCTAQHSTARMSLMCSTHCTYQPGTYLTHIKLRKLAHGRYYRMISQGSTASSRRSAPAQSYAFVPQSLKPLERANEMHARHAPTSLQQHRPYPPPPQILVGHVGDGWSLAAACKATCCVWRKTLGQLPPPTTSNNPQKQAPILFPQPSWLCK